MLGENQSYLNLLHFHVKIAEQKHLRSFSLLYYYAETFS